MAKLGRRHKGAVRGRRLGYRIRDRIDVCVVQDSWNAERRCEGCRGEVVSICTPPMLHLRDARRDG